MNKIIDFIKTPNAIKTISIVGFILIFTGIIASQNFFFQNVIENGISKRDIIAQKTLTVIDVKRTEQHRKEFASKIEPVLTSAEDEFIKTNLKTLENSISQMRKKNVEQSTKWKN